MNEGCNYLGLPPRFWTKVHVSANDGCWWWIAGKQRGYGAFYWKGRLFRAHRLVLEAKLGRPIGANLDACHSCDNRACVNPDHLWEGTRKENLDDMREKGRAPDPSVKVKNGIENGRAKLTEDEVRAIRAATGTSKEIGEQFGLSPAQTNKIRNRQFWKHVA